MSLRAAVFASGRGSNFEVLADHRTPEPPADWRVTLLVSDRPDAPALERARARDIPTAVIPAAGRDPGELARETLAALRAAEADLVLLAGYLRLVPADVVREFRGRMLNVHPALLPSFGGKGMYGAHVHRAVLESGARITGPTIQFVDERYDRGRILAQWPVAVAPDDTPETLAARVTEVEHQLYPAAVDELARALAEGRSPRSLPAGDGATHFLLALGPPGAGDFLEPPNSSERP